MAYNPFNISGQYINSSLYQTLALADSAAVTGGYGLNIDKAWTLTTNTTLASKNVIFSDGVVTLGNFNLIINGAIFAPAVQIFNVNGSGHADLTISTTMDAYAEWWGVVGGDASFNSGHASANKPLIDQALTYGPFRLLFARPGIYSTTGHLLDGNFTHDIIGLGKSVAPGAATIVNGIVGSGLPCTDAANMGSDISATANYVFQSGGNGSAARETNFRSISIAGSDISNVGQVIPVGILGSTTTNNHWNINIYDCALVGYAAFHTTWGNDNIYENDWFFGNYYGIAQTYPVSTSFIIVQKQRFIGGECSQSNTGAGWCLYQSDAITGGTGISGILWDGVTFENGYNGLQLNAGQQQFNSVRLERLDNTVVSEGATFGSCWIMPTFGTPNTPAQLFAGLSTRSIVVLDGPTIGLGNTAKILSNAGNPNGVKSGFVGSICLNSTAAAGDWLYGKSSGMGDTGWVSVLSELSATNGTTTGTITFTVGTDAPIQRFGTPLSGDTTITLSTSGFSPGDWFHVVAPSNLNGHVFTVNGKSLTANQWIRYSVDGFPSWQQIAGGTLL